MEDGIREGEETNVEKRGGEREGLGDEVREREDVE